MPPSLMAFWADPKASAATMEAWAPLEAKKRGNARSTIPRAAKSAALRGLPGAPCLTSASCGAPIWPASQAARLSEVTSQLGGISRQSNTIFTGDQIGTFPARSALSIAIAESATRKLGLTCKRPSKLLHREKCKMVSGGIAEPDFCLCLPNSIRERAAAGHDDTPATAARQGADPISEMAGAGKTAAQLDHDDVTAVHLVGWATFARCRRK